MADDLAKAGAALEQSVPVTHQIVKAKIKSRKWKFKHKRACAFYGNKRKPKMEIERKWPRDGRRAYSQLRTGHSKLLNSYLIQIDKRDNPRCSKCDEEDGDD